MYSIQLFCPRISLVGIGTVGKVPKICVCDTEHSGHFMLFIHFTGYHNTSYGSSED